ncbi:MAG: hypothetical protein GX624_11515 [Actinobacteria bacterium]|nr:hypothetical protein [Actinomycetota bacterium]
MLDDLAGTLRDTNDVMSSQGVRELDLPWPFNDGVFNFNGANQRRVEPRNAPTMINAAFSVDMFWDGRASFIFNGQNPFGFRDREATVTRNFGTAAAPDLREVKVRIPFASHASQAVGPPLSHFEMAGTFRSFPELADKMLDPATKVLGLQVVHPDDSVLGPYAKADYLFGNTGELDDVKGTKSLSTPGADLTYLELIRNTFREEWWNGGPEQVRANFALFFGLSMQMYQASLIADDTPFDRFAGTTAAVREGGRTIAPDPTALTQQELLGLDIFQGTNLSGQNFNPAPIVDPLAPGLVNGGCFNCHILPETTNHNVRLAGAIDPVTFAPVIARGGPTDLENVVVPNALIEPMPFGIFNPVDPAILAPYEDPDIPGTFNLTPQFFLDNPDFLAGFGLYDVGFYNIGIRPTGEDLSRANAGPPTAGFPDGLPLAYTALADLIRQGALDPVADADVTEFVPLIPDPANAIEVPLSAPLPNGQLVAIVNGIPTASLNPVTRGAFKVPNLRNQEFQGPYFHTGGVATLRQVVEFYARGGDFPITNAAHRDADIAPIPGLDVNGPPLPGSTVTAEQRIEALVAFLSHGLTDPRVAKDAAPFDHPQLILPEGANGRVPGSDRSFELMATGASGAEATIPRFLGMDPQATGDPTELGSISGRVMRDGTGEVLQGVAVSAYHLVGESWEQASLDYTDGGGNYRLDGLVPGTYKVRYRDELGSYLPETYDDAPYVLAAENGADVVVTAQNVTANINASLAPLGIDGFEPDDTTGSATNVSADAVQQRTLTPGDHDWITIDARQGTTYTFETSGDDSIDTYIEVFSPTGTRLQANDDGGAGAFSRLAFQATADGALYVLVRGGTGAVAGPYALSISADDVTPPVTVAGVGETYITPAAIEFAATDDWSGVERTEYSLDGGPWTAGTTATVAELGQHTIAYRSVDVAGNVETPTSATFSVIPPTVPTHLSAALSIEKPRYNQRTLVSGALRSESGSGPLVTGETVRLQTSPDGVTWTDVVDLVTDEEGVVTHEVVPLVTTYYRFVYEGKTDVYEPQISEPVKVIPGVYLSRPSAGRAARGGKAFTSTGTLKPRHAAGSKQIVVKAERLQRGKWVVKRGFRAKTSNFKAFSKYTAKVKLTRGIWRIRAYHANDSLNSSTYSAYRYIHVR